MKAKRAEFAFDVGPIFPGYTQGKDWNGWGCPFFTKKVADEIAAFFWFEEGQMTYDAHLDAYLYKDGNLPDTDPYEVMLGVDVDTVDGILHLYPIGSGSWCWNETECAA